MKTIKTLLAASLICLAPLLFCGCTSTTRYCEGPLTQIGIYVPVSGQIYGLQCLRYLNGCVVNAYSNQTMSIQREYAATNSYFGLVETVEWTKTKVDVK